MRFADAEYAGKRKRTRREVLPEEMAQVVPWQSPLALIMPSFPLAWRGHHMYSPGTMFRVDLIQSWFGSSGPAMKEARYGVAPMRAISVDSPPRAIGRRRHRAVGRQRRRFVRQRAGRDDHRLVQDGNHSSTRLVATSRGRGICRLEWHDWFNHRRLVEPIGNVPTAELEPAYDRQRNEWALAA